MAELEQQLAAWVDDQQADVAPVTAAEVLDAAARPPRPARPPARWGRLALAAAAVVVLVVGVAALVRTTDDAPAPLRTGDTTTTTVALPGDGWSTFEAAGGRTILVPPGWSAATYDAPADCEPTRQVTVLANRAQPVEPESICGAVMGADLLDDPGLIAVVLSTGPVPEPSAPNTVVPSTDQLRVRTFALEYVTDEQGNSLVPSRYGEVWSRDGAGLVRIGLHVNDNAIDENLTALDRVIAALGGDEVPTQQVPATGSPQTSTLFACMVDRGYAPTRRITEEVVGDVPPIAQLSWPSTDREAPAFDADLAACEEAGDAAADRFAREFAPWPALADPSQSAAEADRDHVDPALAGRTLTDRGTPVRWFDAREGTWAILTSAPEVAPGSGELVLVDSTGRVVRAWPLPGSPPAWIHVTPDAVYAGRVGDGGIPDSVVLRVDRSNLEGQARFLSAPPDGGTMPDLPGWAEAATDAPWPVTTDPDAVPDPSLTLVDSTIGLTAIDLAAVEALFT